MTLQSSVREIRTGERVLFVHTAFSFARAVNERTRDFFACFLAALGETRQSEAKRIIRRYGNLFDDLRD